MENNIHEKCLCRDGWHLHLIDCNARLRYVVTWIHWLILLKGSANNESALFLISNSLVVKLKGEELRSSSSQHLPSGGCKDVIDVILLFLQTAFHSSCSIVLVRIDAMNCDVF